MGLKGKIVVIILSLILYFTLTLIYQNLILKDKYLESYVLNQSVKKGEKFDINKLTKVKYFSDISVPELQLNNIDSNFVYKKDCDMGEIVNDDLLISKEDYYNLNEGRELIIIKIDELDNNLCGNLTIGDKINLYASARTSDIISLINVEDVESFAADSATGTSTIKLLESVEILKCYDSEGNICKDSQNIQNIMLEVDKHMAIKINNLKNYATFSLTLCM